MHLSKTTKVTIILEIFFKLENGAEKLFNSGIVISAILIFSSRDIDFSYRIKASTLLKKLALNNKIGKKVQEIFGILFNKVFERHLISDNSTSQFFIEFHDKDHNSPIIFWNQSCRKYLFLIDLT